MKIRRRWVAGFSITQTLLAAFLEFGAAHAQTLDSFNIGRLDGSANCFVVQPDGKVVVAGIFRSVGGILKSHLLRAFPDGTLDDGFSGATIQGGPDCMLVQPDGKIIIAGWFASPGPCLARLNPDGTVDQTFKGGATNGAASIVQQSDGKLVVGGAFWLLSGKPPTYLVRLFEDGTLDTNFNVQVDGRTAVEVLPDGGMVLSGMFSNVAGQPCWKLGRLRPDGSLDPAFHPIAAGDTNNYGVKVQPDGKCLVAGNFTNLVGHECHYFGRLNWDGSFDTNFDAKFPIGVYPTWPTDIALQADGKILLTGYFTNPAPGGFTNLARFNADGSLDTSFRPEVRDTDCVDGFALQPDGKLLLRFNHGMYVRRLNSTAPATQSLVYDGWRITWMRGGTSPEVWRTTFESSPDGTNWTMHGAGTRIAGGWELSGVPGLTGRAIRARGFVQGRGEHWFVEATRGTLEAVGFRNGSFGFNVTGSPGQVVVVESSTNMSTWSAVTTNVVSSGSWRFDDLRPKDSRGFFYRLRSQ